MARGAAEAVAQARGRVVRTGVNYLAQMDERPKFHAQDHSLDTLKLDANTVDIRDARDAGLTLEREGITLVPHRTAVKDFRDQETARSVYLKEVERLILDLSGAAQVVVMGAAGLRYAERSPLYATGVNSHPARFIHIDYTDVSAPSLLSALPAGAAARPGQRVAGYNIWRVVSPPPQDVPLAVCDAGTVAPQDLVRGDAIFDVGDEPWWTFEAYLLRSNPAHRWWWYSDMRPDEALVFKSFDSDPGQPVRVPHTAFDDPDAPADAPPRVSVEARAFALFDD